MATLSTTTEDGLAYGRRTFRGYLMILDEYLMGYGFWVTVMSPSLFLYMKEGRLGYPFMCVSVLYVTQIYCVIGFIGI